MTPVLRKFRELRPTYANLPKELTAKLPKGPVVPDMTHMPVVAGRRSMNSR